MIAWAEHDRPPAPRPWTARKAISWFIDSDSPDSTEPIRKIDDRGLEDALAAVEVADLAVQRGRRGRGQQVRGDDPREVVEPAEVADDGRQRGGHDRLVERRQQHAERQPAVDQQDLAVGELARCSAGVPEGALQAGRRGARRSPARAACSSGERSSRASAMRACQCARRRRWEARPCSVRREQGGAAVVRLGRAIDEPGVLELSDLAAGGGDVDLQGGRQLGQAKRPAVGQDRQRDRRRHARRGRRSR